MPLELVTAKMMKKPDRSISSSVGLHEALDHAALVANEAIEAIAPCRDRILEILGAFKTEVRASGVCLEEGEGKAVRSAVDAFSEQYDRLRVRLEGLAQDTDVRMAQSYAALQRDARFVTIMMFGRTKAGKSTTMEALTGGDGSTIGTGQQHYTQSIGAYYFPAPEEHDEPDYPCLRIVDTPGIEGFEGEELAAMAEDFVERSDHIFFLFSDDKAGTEELKRFGQIRTQGKNITVLLNIKSAAEDLDLLVNTPELIFQPQEIEGHRNRISRYLQEHFDIASTEVLPFHADAAWRARTSSDHLAGIGRAELERASGLAGLEERIRGFVTREAVQARRKAPRDLLNGYIHGLKDELRPFAGNFKALADELERVSRRFEHGTERARKRIVRRFPQLRARFQSAHDAIPQMVDGVISRKAGGRKLETEWRTLLDAHGVPESVQWFQEIGNGDFIRELEEQVRVAAADFQASAASDLGQSVDDYYKREKSAERRRYGRAALRTGASTAAASLGWWTVMNWWNPTGWLAASGAAVCIAVTGWGAQELARKATNKWSRIDKREMARSRNRIIRDLRDRLWVDYRRARNECGEWLDRTQAEYRSVALDTARPAMQAARRLHRATTTALDGLDEVADSLNRVYVQELLRDLVPEVADGRIAVTAAVRQPGLATKIRVAARVEGVHPLGACIGARGSRVKELRNALGGEPVEFVDDDATPEARVLQALSVRRLAPALPESAIQLDHGGKATVRARGREGRQLIGDGGANVRLAGRLLNLEIHIGDSA